MIKRIQKILLPVWIACVSTALVLFCVVVLTPLQLIYPSFMVIVGVVGLACFTVWVYMALYGRASRAVAIWRVLLTGLVVIAALILWMLGLLSGLASGTYYPSPYQAQGFVLVENSWLENTNFTVAPKKYGLFHDRSQQKVLDTWPSHPPAQREVHWLDANHAEIHMSTDALNLPAKTYQLEIDNAGNFALQTSIESGTQVEYGWDITDL